MKLELKAIKYCDFASQETYCFEGVIYLDGKPFAHVDNDGHGGADRVNHHQRFNGDWMGKFREIEAYFKSLPKTDVGKYDWAPDGFEQTLESWCHAQVFEYLTKKELKRLLKRCVVAQIKENDELRVAQWNKPKDKPDWLLKEAIKNKYTDVTILNDITENQALEIFQTI